MPTYDYVCKSEKGGCGHREERFLPMSKAPSVVKCPRCHERTLGKTISGVAVTAGTVVPGLRVEYPVYNWQLPVEPGQKPGQQIVQSRQHLRELCARHDLRSDQ